MKKASLLTTVFALVFVLTACGSPRASGNGFGSGGTTGTGFRSNRSNTPLTAESKLALGTMKLEGTRQAVDPAMAAKLIPLWQLMVQLHSSSSSAPQEVAAVEDQIKATMRRDQLSAIDSMTLTQADIFSAFQQQSQANGSGGGSDPAGQGFTQGSSRGNRGGGVFVFGGGPGGGGFGGGGFGGGGFGGGGFGAGGARTNGAAGSNAGSQTSSSLTAAQAAQARANAVSTLVIDQLIRLLETKLSK